MQPSALSQWPWLKMKERELRWFWFWVPFTQAAILVHLFEPQPSGTSNVDWTGPFGGEVG